MNPTWSILFALGGAAFLSLGTVLQWLGHECHGRMTPEPWRVAAQPRWWLGILAGAVGTLSYYAALWTGLLSLVQPLSSLHIVFTAMAMAWLRKEAVQGLRAGSIALVALGVMAGLVGESTESVLVPPQLWGALVFLGVLVVVGLATLLLPRASDRLSIWAGCTYSVSAVAWKGIAEMGATIPGVVVGMIFGASYVLGFVFLQAAFRRGGAASVNAVATGVATALPMLAAKWVFAEPIGILTWIGAALIVAGVVMGGYRRVGVGSGV
jgi:drug/metabolite transporter (DMT)-like permease